MKRILACIITIITVLTLCVSCAKDVDAEALAGTYARQNDTFDSFTIILNKDGTYTYYETLISSHIGYGSYEIEGTTVTLFDDNIPTLDGSMTYTFVFEYKDEKLIYIADKSDDFMYVSLPDGARFELQDDSLSD